MTQYCCRGALIGTEVDVILMQHINKQNGTAGKHFWYKLQKNMSERTGHTGNDIWQHRSAMVQFLVWHTYDKQPSCLQRNYHIGRPRPRPRGMPSPSAADLGFLTVSSTDKMRHAASDAAVSALIFITAGSQTHASKLLAMSSLLMSTPYHVPPACTSTNTNSSLSTTALSLYLGVAAYAMVIHEIELFQNYLSLRRHPSEIILPKFISEAYCSSRIFSNMFNVAEIILK